MIGEKRVKGEERGQNEMKMNQSCSKLTQVEFDERAKNYEERRLNMIDEYLVEGGERKGQKKRRNLIWSLKI